ncbi:hypothetical protein Tco_1236887 [Tanacetum coccineum]
MKPFGCPVTILNTRDHLGKFDGKANEGFFVGYSVVRNRPDWLFDVDSLTKSMNYVPVVAGNQTNDIAELEIILFEEDVGVKPREVDGSEASDKDGKDCYKTQKWCEGLSTRKKKSVHPNSTNSINTVSTPVSTTEPSTTNDAPSSPVNAAKTSEEHLFEQFSPFKNAFTLPDVPNMSPLDDNTRTFASAYDDEDVGTEADLNNLETTMNVSPIPITRIDKDHPKDQIIGDLNLAIQTRRMTKIFDEHAMVRVTLIKRGRTNHKDYQNCLFAYFLSQKESKKGCEALVKRDTPDKLQQRSVKCIFIGYPKETMGYYFYFLPENKIVVARYAAFFEKNLITQEVSGRAIDLEEIQNEDTSPSEITSEIPMKVEDFKPP